MRQNKLEALYVNNTDVNVFLWTMTVRKQVRSMLHYQYYNLALHIHVFLVTYIANVAIYFVCVLINSIYNLISFLKKTLMYFQIFLIFKGTNGY